MAITRYSLFLFGGAKLIPVFLLRLLPFLKVTITLRAVPAQISPLHIEAFGKEGFASGGT